MNKSELKQDECDDIFIVEVNKSSSGSTKIISIPQEVCKFCDINEGDLIKLKLLDKKAKKK